jgi:hypothetical protein
MIQVEKWKVIMQMETRDEKLKRHIDKNIWNHIKDVLSVCKRVNNQTWTWIENPDCKYIDVRIDMRTLNCIIKDDNGNRILPEDLSYQSSDISSILVPNRDRQKRCGTTYV